MWLFRMQISTSLVVWFVLAQVQGILDCCVTLATTLLAFDILSRHSFSQSASAYSALGTLAIMCYTNLRFTYSLFTY